ncbi:hypothetical protein BGW36DRAFT_414457 [Talaromyces proteolyticus]|uniref:AB hydrolase-1 domain-containing protein n=1 Tax=Talaromyces proteolyticus TaxID=1131652 RepID=A0AAD4L220_9EURO|nr:uncharacterized protein BGW36DRAFT_414457 [Talaromyces proteolyticus]KAH8704191.1 hypothetical protein BGW36DRAFT_414457 [Talaromyces proteolyticus]
MATPNPTLVIIHGGWHILKSYEKLIVALKDVGYEVHCPRLPTTNQSRPPNADFYTDSDLVHTYVSSLVQAGRSVVTIMHSDALVGLGQETRAKDGMMDKVREFGHMDLVPIAFDFADDDTCLNNDPRSLLIGPSDLAAEEVDQYLATLVRWNGKFMYLPIRHAAWREIPVAYIYSTADMTVPIDYQRSFVEGMEKASRPVRTFNLAIDHCPHLTATAGVVDAIEQIVKS